MLSHNRKVAPTFLELIQAIERNDKEAVHRLLIEGVDPNSFDGFDTKTALYVAVEYGNIEIVKLLLKYGADDYRTFNGMSPSQRAYELEYDEIADLLSDANCQDWFVKRMESVGCKSMPAGICFSIAYLSVLLNPNLFSGILNEMSKVPLKKFPKVMRSLEHTLIEFTKEANGSLTALRQKEIDSLFAENFVSTKPQTLSQKKTYLKKMFIDRKIDQLPLKSKLLINIPYIFNGIKLLSEPWLFSEHIYEKESLFSLQTWLALKQEKYVHRTLKLLMPLKMEQQGGLVCIDHFSGIYKLNELAHQFERLVSIINAVSPSESFSSPISFILKGNQHTLNLKIFQNQKEIILTDINQFPTLQKITDTKLLSKKIIEAYFSKNKIASFSTIIYALKSDAAIIKKCIEKWRKDPSWLAIHTINSKRLALKDSHGQSWYSNCDSGGEPDVFIELQKNEKHITVPKNALSVMLSLLISAPILSSHTLDSRTAFLALIFSLSFYLILQQAFNYVNTRRSVYIKNDIANFNSETKNSEFANDRVTLFNSEKNNLITNDEDCNPVTQSSKRP